MLVQSGLILSPIFEYLYRFEKFNFAVMEQETNRQKKVATLIQHDLAEIIQKELRGAGQSNIIVSVTKVRVTSDFSLAKAYLSIFPNDKVEDVMEDIQRRRTYLKNQVAQRTKHQLRKFPELLLYLDD